MCIRDRYNLFGFTGTPIFAQNAGTGGDMRLKTTQQAFGDKLHTYTIVDAINDENVLPFRIDYINTIKEKEGILDKQISAIDREKAMASPERVSQVVKYILDHFDQKPKRSSFYSFRVLDDIHKVASAKKGAEVSEHKTEQKLAGFNAMFAVASIPMAKAYYNEFKKQQENLPEAQRLKIATIYSYGANEEEIDGILAEENPESTTNLDQQSRDFLEGAIQDYNKMFSTNYDTSSDRFQNYYKDLSLRMKNRQVDLLIVVNMFLTGFDATTLNTLFVDKNLKQHGLIQAFSRTNRILNLSRPLVILFVSGTSNKPQMMQLPCLETKMQALLSSSKTSCPTTMDMTQRRASIVMDTRNLWNSSKRSSQRENPSLEKRQKRGLLDCLAAS